MYIYICVYIYIHMYIYIFTNTQLYSYKFDDNSVWGVGQYLRLSSISRLIIFLYSSLRGSNSL